MARQAIVVLGSILFLVVAPGTVGGLLPYWISGWEMQPAFLGVWSFRVGGGVLLFLGIAALVECFVRFALQGKGTPSPVVPTEILVVSGLYRFVRNPMYVAVVGIIAGQALLFGCRDLLLYAGAVWLLFQAIVLLYEEPVLDRRYGESYRAYRHHVRRWWPRLSPWQGSSGGG